MVHAPQHSPEGMPSCFSRVRPARTVAPQGSFTSAVQQLGDPLRLPYGHVTVGCGRRPGIERRAFSRSESAVWGVVETFFATVITKRVRAPPGEENQQ